MTDPVRDKVGLVDEVSTGGNDEVLLNGPGGVSEHPAWIVTVVVTVEAH